MEDTMVEVASIVLFVLNILAATFVAGLIALIITKATETWGGLVGGAISSTPTLAIPLSLGVTLSSTNSATALVQTMWIIPVGLFLASTCLVMWRLLPLALPKSMALVHRLAATVAVSLFCWSSGAVVCYFATAALQRATHAPIEAIGGIALACNFALSVPAAFIKPVPASTSVRPISGSTYALRGTLAASSVGGAVLISNWNPVLAGIVAGIPALAVSSLIGQWITRGEKAAAGGVGSLMLGGLSTSAYCAVFGTLYATLFGVGLGQPLSILLALSASYLASVLLVSAPGFLTLWWLARFTSKRRSRQREVDEEEGVMVEEEDDENSTTGRLFLNNRGAIADPYTSKGGQQLGIKEERDLGAPLLASTSGHHQTYRACSSGENDWKADDSMSRLAVRRHLLEETEQRIKMKGHDRPQHSDSPHQRQAAEHDGEKENKVEAAAARKWVDVMVVNTRLPEEGSALDEPPLAMSTGDIMGGSGEVEGKLQPALTERTLRPLR